MRPALVALAILAVPSAASSQEWRASARFGRVTGESAPAGASASSSVVLGLGRTATRDWVWASAALPLGEDPFWATLGGWKRFDSRGAAGVLLDLSLHGFIQRQGASGVGAPAPAPSPGPLPLPSRPSGPIRSDLTGEGVGGDLMVGGFTGSETLRLEARAGASAQRSRLGDAVGGRLLPTGDARVTLPAAPLALHAETRGWLDDGITHAYLGAGMGYARGPVRLWASLGRWIAGGLEDLAWSAGAGVGLAPGVELQAGSRGNAFDPLYLSATETSVWAGFNLRLGRTPAAGAPVPARDRDGQAIIGLPVREARGTPSIAGDFTGWKAVPMRREGSRWTYTAKVEPGVYHYAFVAEDGTWFVPKSVPGRRDDGMGGQVAVLVVS